MKVNKDDDDFDDDDDDERNKFEKSKDLISLSQLTNDNQVMTINSVQEIVKIGAILVG